MKGVASNYGSHVLELIDLRTAVIIAGLLSGLMSLVLYSAYLSFPRDVGGLRTWAIADGLMTLAAFGLAMRDILPSFFSIVVANVLYLAACLLMASGTRELKEIVPISFRSMMISLALAATLLWLTYRIPILNARIIMMSALSCTYYYFQATTVWRNKQFSIDYAFIVVMFCGLFVSLLRCVGATYFLASANTDEHFLAPSTLNSPYLMMFAVLALLQSITFFLMATRKLQAEMQKMATLDSLTGVLNRRAMMESVTAIINIAKRKAQPISLIFFDLDKFKDINDTFGHRGGDVVLRHFADLMKFQKRESDILARLGGEEFALILPDTDNKQALVVAKRIHSALNSKQQNDVPEYRASIGVSTMIVNRVACDACAEAIFGQLLKSADDALYVAKKNGRNRIEVAAQVVLSLVVAESA